MRDVRDDHVVEEVRAEVHNVDDRDDVEQAHRPRKFQHHKDETKAETSADRK